MKLKTSIKAFWSNNKFLLLLFFVSIALFPFIKYWKADPFFSDVNQYYSYLIALFIHNDLSFSFENGFWLHEGPIGFLVQKMSIGVSYLYAPFFLIGHGLAQVGPWEANGYSAPYAYSIAFGTILYVFFGLWYVKKSLLFFYSEKVANYTLVITFFGTNLLFYTIGWGPMSHSYLFFLMAAGMYHTLKWYEERRTRQILIVAFVCGVMTVARPLEGLFVLFPLMYNMTSIKGRLLEFWNYRNQLILASVAFLVPILPQLMYWKIFTGSWLYFSYHDEGFFFADPKILEVLFSFRKGLFIYSPLALLGVIGLYFTSKKPFFKGTLGYYLVNLFFVASWWCWWYGGSFGMRALVQSFAVMALPMAAVVENLLSSERIKKAFFVLGGFFIVLNLTQSYQYSHNTIHWDSMTRKSYFISLFNFEYDANERVAFDEAIEEPDYIGARKGKRELTDIVLPPPPKKEVVVQNLFKAQEHYVLSPSWQFGKSLETTTSIFKSSNNQLQFSANLKSVLGSGKLALVLDLYQKNERFKYLSKDVMISSDQTKISGKIPLEGIPLDTLTSFKAYIYLPEGDGVEVWDFEINEVGEQ